jgi:hypothetical protein
MDYSYFRFTFIPHFVGFTRLFIRVAIGRFHPEQVAELETRHSPRSSVTKMPGDLSTYKGGETVCSVGPVNS